MRQMGMDPSKRWCKLLRVLCRFRVTFHRNRDNSGVTDNQMEVSRVHGSTLMARQLCTFYVFMTSWCSSCFNLYKL